MAAFDADQRGDFALLVGAAHLGGGGGQDEIGGISLDDVVADGVDHFQGAVGGVVSLDVARRRRRRRRTGRPYRLVSCAACRSCESVVGLPDVEAGDGAAGDVVVSVDEERGFVEAADFGIAHLALPASGGLGGKDRSASCRYKANAGDAHFAGSIARRVCGAFLIWYGGFGCTGT